MLYKYNEDKTKEKTLLNNKIPWIPSKIPFDILLTILYLFSLSFDSLKKEINVLKDKVK